MIPDKILRFLNEYAILGFAGTQRGLVPHGHRVSGWRVGADRRTMTAFVPAPFTAHLVESLESNGRFAVTIEEYPSHETYQFKGRFLGHRPMQPDDIKAVDRIRERFVKNMRPLYEDVADEALRRYILDAHLAVEFAVEEIYVQTPGPGAGRRLVPAPEA